MLALFRNNQFTSSILLAIYALLVRSAAFVGVAKAPEPPGRDGGIMAEWICDFAGRFNYLSPILAAALVVFQAILVNNLDSTFRVNADRSWLPGMFYVLSASILPEFLYLSPVLLAVTFVPFALRSLFETYKQQSATGLVFDVAFWITVGSLFYPPLIFLLLAGFIGLSMVRSFNFRERLVFLTGCIVPLFMGWLWYYWRDSGGIFWGKQFGGLFGLYRFDTLWDIKSMLQAGLVSLLVLATLVGYSGYHYKKLMQVQKYIDIFYWFMLLAAMGIFLRSKPLPEYWLLLAPSLGIFLGSTFLGIKNRPVAEILHLVLLGTVLFFHFVL